MDAKPLANGKPKTAAEREPILSTRNRRRRARKGISLYTCTFYFVLASRARNISEGHIAIRLSFRFFLTDAVRSNSRDWSRYTIARESRASVGLSGVYYTTRRIKFLAGKRYAYVAHVG